MSSGVWAMSACWPLLFEVFDCWTPSHHSAGLPLLILSLMSLNPLGLNSSKKPSPSLRKIRVGTCPPNDAAVGRVHEIQVAVVVEVAEVAVARPVDEAPAPQHEVGVDGRVRVAEADPALEGLVLVEAGRLALDAAQVDQPAVRLVVPLRGVRDVDVEVPVVVDVREFDVAAVVEDAREARRGVVLEEAQRAPLEAPGVDPDLVLVVPVVAAVGDHDVPVPVEVDVSEVGVLGARAVRGSAGDHAVVDHVLGGGGRAGEDGGQDEGGREVAHGGDGRGLGSEGGPVAVRTPGEEPGPSW